jgi:hypothetical protein
VKRTKKEIGQLGLELKLADILHRKHSISSLEFKNALSEKDNQ